MHTIILGRDHILLQNCKFRKNQCKNNMRKVYGDMENLHQKNLIIVNAKAIE